MRALVLALLFVAPLALAQTGPASTVAEQARQWMERGREGDAARAVRSELEKTPEDAELLTIMLQLQQRGAGLFASPPFERRRIRRRTAERLLAADSTSAIAHDELGRQSLETYLFDRDLISVGAGFDISMAPRGRTSLRQRPFGGAREARFKRGGRYDLSQLRATYPVTSRHGIRDVQEAAASHLQCAVTYGGEASLWPLARLLLADQAYDALESLARRFDDSALLGVALYRTGHIREAEAAFDRARSKLSASAQDDWDDARRVRPNDPPEASGVFWAEQDVRQLTNVNERLTEHRARVIEADLLFGWREAPGRDEPRGQIYIRYGAPTDRATLSQPFYPGDAHSSSNGFVLASYRFDVWEYASGLRYVFSDPVWSGEYSLYAPSAVAFAHTPDADADDYIAQDVRLRRDDPDASQYAPEARIPLTMHVSALRGQDGATDLLVATSAPASGPLSTAGSVQTGVFALGGAKRSERRGTQPSTVPVVHLASGATWTTATVLQTASGAVEVASEVARGETAAGWVREAVDVRSFGSGLTMSDLVLAYGIDEGRAAQPGEVLRGGIILQPSATGVLASGDPIALYAEAYGLSQRDGLARYEVEARLLPEDRRAGLVRALGGLFGRGTRRGVSLSVEATSTETDVQIPLFLDASGQPPGVYTLTLTLTDSGSDESVRAERTVVIE